MSVFYKPHTNNFNIGDFFIWILTFVFNEMYNNKFNTTAIIIIFSVDHLFFIIILKLHLHSPILVKQKDEQYQYKWL